MGGGKLDRLPDLAAVLVREKMDVLVSAGGNSATRALKQATTSIPIVMTYGSDPVAAGFVSSLARPGGIVTGLTSITGDLSGKRLELLTETIPNPLVSQCSTIRVIRQRLRSLKRYRSRLGRWGYSLNLLKCEVLRKSRAHSNWLRAGEETPSWCCIPSLPVAAITSRS